MGRRYESMTLDKANDECRSRDSMDFQNCPECKMRVGLHCSDCKVQVTGCLCTEMDRFGQDEAWRRACERFGEDLARQHYLKAGLLIPRNAN